MMSRIRSRQAESRDVNTRRLRDGAVVTGKVGDRQVREIKQWPGQRRLLGPKDFGPDVVEEFDGRYVNGETVTYLSGPMTVGTDWTPVPLANVDGSNLDGRLIEDLPFDVTVHRFITVGYKRVRLAIADCPVGAAGLEVRVLVNGAQRGPAYTGAYGFVLEPEEFLIGRCTPADEVEVQVRSQTSTAVTGTVVQFEHIDLAAAPFTPLLAPPNWSSRPVTKTQAVAGGPAETINFTRSVPTATQPGDVVLVTVMAFAYGLSFGGFPRANWSFQVDPRLTLVGQVEYPGDINIGVIYLYTWTADAPGATSLAFQYAKASQINSAGSMEVQCVLFDDDFPLIVGNPVAAGQEDAFGTVSAGSPQTLAVPKGAAEGNVVFAQAINYFASGSHTTPTFDWLGSTLQEGTGPSFNSILGNLWAVYPSGSSPAVEMDLANGSGRTLALAVELNVQGTPVEEPA